MPSLLFIRSDQRVRFQISGFNFEEDVLAQLHRIFGKASGAVSPGLSETALKANGQNATKQCRAQSVFPHKKSAEV
jgi:hypothetical protein